MVEVMLSIKDNINCGRMFEPEWPKKYPVDKTVEKPFCIQVDDKDNMFRVIAKSTYKETKNG